MDTTVVDAADLDATEIVAFVRTVPIFHTLSKDQLRQIAEAAEVRIQGMFDKLAVLEDLQNDLRLVDRYVLFARGVKNVNDNGV